MRNYCNYKLARLSLRSSAGIITDKEVAEHPNILTFTDLTFQRKAVSVFVGNKTKCLQQGPLPINDQMKIHNFCEFYWHNHRYKSKVNNSVNPSRDLVK